MKILVDTNVLGLNIHVYPEYIESYIEQAKLYLHKWELAPTEECLLKAQSIQPDNAAVAEMLKKIRA